MYKEALQEPGQREEQARPYDQAEALPFFFGTGVQTHDLALARLSSEPDPQSCTFYVSILLRAGTPCSIPGSLEVAECEQVEEHASCSYRHLSVSPDATFQRVPKPDA